MVTIKSSAEALAKCTTAFARYFEGFQRGDNPRDDNCEQQSHQHQTSEEVSGSERCGACCESSDHSPRLPSNSGTNAMERIMIAVRQVGDKYAEWKWRSPLDRPAARLALDQ